MNLPVRGPVLEAAILLSAYVVGSIPFSFVVARLFGVPDVRKVGSGNVGATNVMRSAGRAAGFLALLLDASKGALAALLAQRFTAGWVPPLAAAAAVLGHMYPPFLGFKGGKGVATGAGAFSVLAPEATGFAVAAFALTAAITRYASLASIAGSATLTLLAFVLGSSEAVAWTAAAVATLVVFKHRGNLERLVRGTESRLGSTRP